MSFSLIVFNFLLCRFETMVGWIDVHAQFNDGEPQRLKVWCLDVTLRGLKDELNEFNQGVNSGYTRRVENVRYKCPTFDEGRVSFTWVKLKNDENVTNMFWEHNMCPVDRYACNVAEINWRYYQQFDSARRSWLGRECTFQLQQLSSSRWANLNLLNGRSPAYVWKCYCSIQKVKFLLASFKWWYWSVKVWTSFRWHLDTII